MMQLSTLGNSQAVQIRKSWGGSCDHACSEGDTRDCTEWFHYDQHNGGSSKDLREFDILYCVVDTPFWK